MLSSACPPHPKKQIKADDQEARRQELLDQGYSAAQIDAIFVRQHRQEVMAEVCRHWFPKKEVGGRWEMGDHLEHFLNHMSHPFHLVFIFLKSTKVPYRYVFLEK